MKFHDASTEMFSLTMATSSSPLGEDWGRGMVLPLGSSIAQLKNRGESSLGALSMFLAQISEGAKNGIRG